MQTLHQRRAKGDRVQKKSFRIGLARLHVVRPAHGANAGYAVVERDEPEPAMIEPEQADISLSLSRVTLRARKVAENRRTVVRGIASLGTEFTGEQRIATRRIDNEFRPPLFLAAIFMPDGYRRPLSMEFHARRAATLYGNSAFARRIAKQNMVKLRAANLVRIRKGFIDRIGKIESDRVRMPRRHELGAIFGHADRLDFVCYAEPIEQRHIERQ